MNTPTLSIAIRVPADVKRIFVADAEKTGLTQTEYFIKLVLEKKKGDK